MILREDLHYINYLAVSLFLFSSLVCFIQEILMWNLYSDACKGVILHLIIRETLERYSEDIREVTIAIMKFITMSLELQDTQISESFREGLYDIRMNCYPPCPEPERVLGIVPHADNSGITLLLDCADFSGLQFLKDQKWVNVEPIEGAIVVNIGQIIEVCTCDSLDSTFNHG